MKYTYFNWTELYTLGRKDNSAILLLLFAQSPLYNVKTVKGLMSVLKINRVPPWLFETNLFVKAQDIVVCTYKTQQPQSYIKNPFFMVENVDIVKKISYIRALSTRPITDKRDAIARNYFRDIQPNPFMQVDDNYIRFTYEASRIREPNLPKHQN